MPAPNWLTSAQANNNNAVRDATVCFMNGNIFFYRLRTKESFIECYFKFCCNSPSQYVRSMAALDRIYRCLM